MNVQIDFFMCMFLALWHLVFVLVIDFLVLVLKHWYKDVKWSTKVKDKDGYPSFALVNKVTGEAIKHSIGASHPVRY